MPARPGLPLRYPETRRDDVVEELHGRPIADPYRWLEDPDSPETRAWVEAQNAVTETFLAAIPQRAPIRQRLTRLWDHERFGLPQRRGPWYVFTHNDGLQNQDVLYRARSLDDGREQLLDPNTLSPDGTVALGLWECRPASARDIRPARGSELAPAPFSLTPPNASPFFCRQRRAGV